MTLRFPDALEQKNHTDISIVHSNKSQNYRLKSIEQFDRGAHRIMVTTDVMARGLDLDKMSHVFNFDTPEYPENYMHRIGRTGRAEKVGISMLLFTKEEEEAKGAIESLMDYKIPLNEFPEGLEISKELIPDERPKEFHKNPNRNFKKSEAGPAFHEKKEKNKKTNQGGSYLRKRKTYKKPQTRGDKIMNQKSKKRR